MNNQEEVLKMKNVRRVRAGLGYVTRPQALELIAVQKGLTNKDNEFHQIYRQLGRDMREGKLPNQPLGGGRVKKIAEKDIYEYAKRFYDVKIEELNPSLIYNIENKMDFSVVENIKSIIKLEDQGILSKEQAFDALKNVLEHGML
jgi:hypothetical protein